MESSRPASRMSICDSENGADVEDDDHGAMKVEEDWNMERKKDAKKVKVCLKHLVSNDHLLNLSASSIKSRVDDKRSLRTRYQSYLLSPLGLSPTLMQQPRVKPKTRKPEVPFVGIKSGEGWPAHAGLGRSGWNHGEGRRHLCCSYRRAAVSCHSSVSMAPI